VDDLIAGRYELEELTGSGGMSRVYVARDRQLGRRVAVKILHERFADDESYVERFRREARAVAQLNHPNIVTVIDRGESDGVQYIVFEHVEGEDLKELVVRTGPLPVRRAIELAVQIGRALSFAHANGVVHRDVKPQNVLLRDGNAKVTDFGIARADGVEFESADTTTGTVLGTGDYISPEQARGERADEQSDVYSLGALLFELLTGHVPYPAESAVAAAMRHTTDPVPDVLAERPDVPARLATAVERALAKDRSDRFPSMDDFVDELIACRNELPPVDAAQTMILPAQADERPRPALAGRGHGRRIVVPLLALVLLAGLAVGGYELWRHEHRSSSFGGGKPAAAATAHLTAVGAYDPPPGDGRERNDQIPGATDGNPSTYWQTEHYTTAAFGNLKQGVGLVLDAGKSVRLGSLTIKAPTPGFAAEIKAGTSPSGPFSPVSSDQTVADTTTFTLNVPDGRRYYLIWITRLVQFDTGDPSKPFGARISEVTAG
jgi:eukaryotic-like serine/threonine-protein kinase